MTPMKEKCDPPEGATTHRLTTTVVSEVKGGVAFGFAAWLILSSRPPQGQRKDDTVKRWGSVTKRS